MSPLAALLAAPLLFAQTAIDQRISFTGGHEQEFELAEGQAVEISVGIQSPSQLPANGRLAVEWNGPADGLSFRKVLHALDPDVYVIYRAPQAGKYTLALSAVEEEEPAGSSPRWRETGALAAAKAFPQRTPWPAEHAVDMRTSVKPVDFGPADRGHLVELEPNNSISQAQMLPIAATHDDQILHLTGGADDIEYFDNDQYGESGDDWFRLEFKGTAERLLSVNLMPTDPLVAARVRVYTPDGKEFMGGKHLNETAHEPYTELADLLAAIEPLLDSNAADLVSRRLTHAAATYHNASYGSNGTGQLGYSTPGASQTIGRSIGRFWRAAEAAGDEQAVQLSVEAAANVIHEGVQQKLLNYSIKGPDKLRPIAASSLSDPRAVILPTTPEFVGPLVERIHASAQTEEGRRQVTRITVRQLSSARWDMPTSAGRQREFFSLLIPKLDDPTSDTQWFLAEQIGRIMAANPDFRTPTLLAMVPKSFASPLEETFWLPSAGWMLTYGSPVPEVGQSAAADTTSEVHRFALDLIVRNLDPSADRRSRAVAVSMLYQPALYSTPELIAAASRIDAGNFRRLFPEAFERDLAEAIEPDNVEPNLDLTDRRRRNFAYFRDFVVPELGRESRADGDSCFSCHGGGKVPSLSLVAPDRRSRYLSPPDTWTNYRTLLARIDKADPAASKVLRKPLNFQTGKEDGHQGGLRYKPGDRGYEILRRWVLDAAELE